MPLVFVGGSSLSKDQIIGIALMSASILAIIAYAWILFFTEWTILLIQITLMIAVVGILGIVAWIGYTLATTPPPKPLEEIEKELEEELKHSESKE
ncbi:MAG: transcriptional regulator [Nitrososphaerota archaeon]